MNGRWPTIEEHESEAEEVEAEVPVFSNQETGKNMAIKFFKQNINVKENTNKKEEVDSKIELNNVRNESQYRNSKRTLSKLINLFEDNIISSSVLMNQSFLSPNKPSIKMSQDPPQTICHAQVHSAPKQESEVFCSLSVANRIKMLDNLNNNNKNIIHKLDTSSSKENRREPLRVTGSVGCLLYTSPSPRDGLLSRMPSSA